MENRDGNSTPQVGWRMALHLGLQIWRRAMQASTSLEASLAQAMEAVAASQARMRELEQRRKDALHNDCRANYRWN